MQKPALIAALVLTLSGCSVFMPAPISAPSATWTPTFVPLEREPVVVTATPTPSTKKVKAVSPTPGTTYACRPLTQADRVLLAKVDNHVKSRPIAAVDLGDGWSIFAYYELLADGEIFEATVVTNGQRITMPAQGRPDGNYTDFGVSFDDWSTAYSAAQKCVGHAGVVHAVK